MKAEEYLTKGTGNFSNCTDYDDAIKAMKDYARIQIEKDRERVKADFKPEHFCDDYHYNMVQKGIDNTPINLD
jgi:hypothetical protein